MSKSWLLIPALAACAQGADVAESERTQHSLNVAGASGKLQPTAELVADDAHAAAAIGSGELSKPVAGPAPFEACNLGGAKFKLVKNWDFGVDGNVRDIATLSSEFTYHDQFGTIANGTNYGAVTVAPDVDSAIYAAGLNLPMDQQPIEDPARPYRELTADALRTYVRPLSPTQQSVSASRHDAGNGSIMAKWQLPSAGSALGHDLLWETRMRMPEPVQGYWMALWVAGGIWDYGPEIDVMESFGAPHIPADAFHAIAVGGTGDNDFSAWPNALDRAGVPSDGRDLSAWHTWTLVYKRDDSYQVYYDSFLVQTGSLSWRVGGREDGDVTSMHFLFDLSWGHTSIADVNIALWSSLFPLTYEIDYSRVYMR